MGVAAYYRGNRIISEQICRERGCSGCRICRPYKPTPRPPGWGEKAAARALERARRVIASAARYSLPIPDEETLAAILRDKERVGETTAREAARLALAESPGALGERNG